MIVEAPLPPLYGSWLRAITGGPIPAETKATCDHCAMLPHGDNPPPAEYFHPAVKCCSYQPQLPNFLAGRILSDDRPALAPGRHELEQRISKKIAVTPVWAGPGAVFGLLYRSAPAVFGRATALRCHFLTPAGDCAIWAHRPGVCATWFCKHDRGNTGFVFWRTGTKLLQYVEQELALWCAIELKIALNEILKADSTAVPDVSELGGELDHARYRRAWGEWIDREPDFYRACARLVDPLSWDQVQNICGPRVRILADLLRDAYAHLLSDAIPERLRFQPFQVTTIEPGRSRIVAYSALDPLSIPDALTRALPYFDGRPTDDALTTILQDHNIHIDPALLRRMIDFGILAPCDPPQLLSIKGA